MAFKQIGGIDWKNGHLGRFLTYCDECHAKVILTEEEQSDILDKFLYRVSKRRKLVRRTLIKFLTVIVTKL